jgi:hypothetical protein
VTTDAEEHRTGEYVPVRREDMAEDNPAVLARLLRSVAADVKLVLDRQAVTGIQLAEIRAEQRDLSVNVDKLTNRVGGLETVDATLATRVDRVEHQVAGIIQRLDRPHTKLIPTLPELAPRQVAVRPTAGLGPVRLALTAIVLAVAGLAAVLAATTLR